VGEDYKTDYTRVPAELIGFPPTNWYARGALYVGSDSGVVVNSPVLAGVTDGEALVGKITSVTPNSSVVTFITESAFYVGITIPDPRARGILQASSTPGQLIATNIPRERRVEPNQLVATGGFSKIDSPSVFPPGIPVGLVTSVGSSDPDAQQTVQVKPFVDPRSVSYVVVLAPTSDMAKRRASGR
jgi:rod shape-determining protein MreC